MPATKSQYFDKFLMFFQYSRLSRKVPLKKLSFSTHMQESPPNYYAWQPFGTITDFGTSGISVPISSGLPAQRFFLQVLALKFLSDVLFLSIIMANISKYCWFVGDKFELLFGYF